MARISAVRFRAITRPLRTTFSTALGQKRHIQSVLVEVRLEDGKRGVGEVPTSFAFERETIQVIGRTLAEAGRRLRGTEIEDYENHVVRLRSAFPQQRMTISGLEVALFRAFLNEKGLGELDYWGRARTRIETDITLPFLDDERLLGSWIDRAARKGFAQYKLKMSGDAEKDEAVLDYVCRSLASRISGFRLRLDGNQGFTARTYVKFLKRIEKMGSPVELFEQPLRKDDFRGFEAIRGKGRMPVILDETVLSVDDARRVIDNGLGDGINVKIAKSGIRESFAIAGLAKQNGLGLMIGCMTETMAGLSAAIFLALGTALFDFIDLDSVFFLYGRNGWPGIRTEGPITWAD